MRYQKRTLWRLASLASICLVWGLFGCSRVLTAQDTEEPKALNSFEQIKTSQVTFNQNVAPIIFEKCSRCHRPGQSGPFSLLNYRDVSRRSRTIAAVIESGYMPPWKPVHMEGVFRNERQLSDREKAVLNRWIELGRPEGEGQPPAHPIFPDGWQLGPPDLVIGMQKAFEVPAEGRDIYRSFVFPIALPEDKWIKAVEYHPTATSSVHHAIFFLDLSGNARKMEGSDGKPGIEGMNFLAANESPGDAGGNGFNFASLRERFRGGSDPNESPGVANNPLNRTLGAYVPGWTPARLPRDLALKLPAGADLVMQTHFHPSGRVEKEQGKIGLYFADKRPSQLMVPIQVPAMFGVGAGLKIPAGEKNHVLKESFTIPVDVELVSVGAHAHYVCREVRMTAKLPGGETRRVLQIDDWDLDWQDRYYFREQVRLPAGTVLTSELIYDNSDSNPENPNQPPVDIRWGRESGDEMGSVTLHVVAVRESERSELESALRKYFLQSITQGDIVAMLMQLDTNRDGGLQKSEVPPRLASRFRWLDRNQDGKLVSDELQVLKQILNRGGRR